VKGRVGLGIAAGVALCLVAAAGLVTSAVASRNQVRPQITVIEAKFNEELRATFYDVHLNDPVAPTSTWTWEFQPPPDDLTCKRFSVVTQEQAFSQAVWYHSNDDGCSHKGIDHNGTIEVTVVNGDYTCNATITGTTDHFGPDPQPCFKKPSTSTTKPTTTTTPTTSGGTTPAQDKPQKQKDKLNKCDALLEGVGAVAMGVGTFIGVVGGIIFTIGGAETATIFGAPAGVPTMIAGGALALVGAGLTGLGKYYAYVAVDPPDFHTSAVATPRSITLPHAKTPAGSSAAAKNDAAAINAQLDNVGKLVAVLQALRTSVDRATAAIQKGRAADAARQRKAVATYARQAADLIEQDVKLRKVIVAAFNATHTRLVVSRSGMKTMAARAAQNPLGGPATTTLRRLGLGTAAIDGIRRDMVRRMTRAQGLSFPAVLVNAKADAAELAVAASLRLWAKNVAAH
jgi:hypothetical protein